MATLTVTAPGNTDFRGAPAETDIDLLLFQAPDDAQAIFNGSQFGGGLISPFVQIAGDNIHANKVTVIVAANGTFSAAGWTFSAWSAGDDVIQFSSNNGDANITGSSQDDLFLPSGGLTILEGGGGNDRFQMSAEDLYEAGSNISGGAGVDELRLSGSDVLTLDLKPIQFIGVETLNFLNQTTVFMVGSQFGPAGIGSLKSENGEVSTLDVSGNSIDLSGVSFLSWQSEDKILLHGTSASTNTLIGSNEKDIIAATSNSADIMTGGGGADTLNGGGGADIFRYLDGADVQPGETVNGGAATDTIVIDAATAINFSALAIGDVERFRFGVAGATAIFTGNQIADSEIATILGTRGIDHLIVTTNNQFTDLSGVVFSNWAIGDIVEIRGSVLQDLLQGSSQNDIIDGGALADLMGGGAGNDTYIVDVSNEFITELAGNGIDLVKSNASSFVLAANQEIENLTLTGNGNIAGTGNGLANLITGNAGNNRLEGGGGADTLIGGLGNDTYVNPNGDTITEGANAGTDTVESSVAFSLEALPNVERLFLSGTLQINGSGNALGNQINGNAANNILRGFAGNDSMNGGEGNDTLEGGAGNDTMTGAGGVDIFRLAIANAGADTINGFLVGADKFDLQGGTFTAKTEAGGNTTLTHTGGTVLVSGVTGLSITQWNGLQRQPVAPETAASDDGPVNGMLHDTLLGGGLYASADYP